MMFQKDWPAYAEGKFDVSEGASGIITVRRHNEIVFHIVPDCNIEAALENLEAFFDLPTGETGSVRNQFLALDRDWVATTVSPLFWNFFLQYTKYRTIINAVRRGDVELNFTGSSRLEEILVALELHRRSTVPNSFVQRCYFTLIRMRNRLVVKKDAELLLVCQTLDNFRLSEIADALMERFSIVRYVGFRKDTVFKHFFDQAVMFAEGPAAERHRNACCWQRDSG